MSKRWPSVTFTFKADTLRYIFFNDGCYLATSATSSMVHGSVVTHEHGTWRWDGTSLRMSAAMARVGQMARHSDVGSLATASYKESMMAELEKVMMEEAT